jgi:hypothetical protein
MDEDKVQLMLAVTIATVTPGGGEASEYKELFVECDDEQQAKWVEGELWRMIEGAVDSFGTEEKEAS